MYFKYPAKYVTAQLVLNKLCLFMLGILEELKKHKYSLWSTTFTMLCVSVQFTWMAVHKKGYELRVGKSSSDRARALIK